MSTQDDIPAIADGLKLPASWLNGSIAAQTPRDRAARAQRLEQYLNQYKHDSA